jgi:hypothetical protein
MLLSESRDFGFDCHGCGPEYGLNALDSSAFLFGRHIFALGHLLLDFEGFDVAIGGVKNFLEELSGHSWHRTSYRRCEWAGSFRRRTIAFDSKGRRCGQEQARSGDSARKPACWRAV